MAHQHRKAISAKKRWKKGMIKIRRKIQEMLTGRPHDTRVQKANSDNENVDAV